MQDEESKIPEATKAKPVESMEAERDGIVVWFRDEKTGHTHVYVYEDTTRGRLLKQLFLDADNPEIPLTLEDAGRLRDWVVAESFSDDEDVLKELGFGGGE